MIKITRFNIPRSLKLMNLNERLFFLTFVPPPNHGRWWIGLHEAGEANSLAQLTHNVGLPGPHFGRVCKQNMLLISAM
jgi:hypothetical protein